MSFANLKVGARLGLGFGALIALMVIIVSIGINNMRNIQGRLDSIVHHEFPKTAYANNILESVNAIGIYMRDALLVTGQENIQREIDGVIKNRALIKENVAKLQELINSEANKATADKDRAELAKVLDARSKYISAQDNFIKLLSDGQQEAAKIYLLSEAMELQDNYIELLNALTAYQREVMQEIGDEADRQVQNIVLMVMVFTLIALVVAVLTGILIARSITHPLQQAVELAGAVAKGDLTRQIEVKSGDETGQLLQALKDMNDSLTGIVGEVRGTTESITTASQEIAQGNNDLSQRTEEQASSLEETASSMEELTSTVRQNAENARQANQLAANASDVAVKGGKVVGDVVHTMASISDSSRKIVDIISVIEGIAFQTNILALNAAVEAARAGEQGRGFAVVAGEVRNLAQRSAAAAKEIKELIDNSVSKVDAGAKQVDQAGATMTEIVQAVKRVTDIMSEIAAASNEQSAGIEQVNQAITQMDEVTQQNAALVEEASAAAESMREQAGMLMRAVSIFRLDGSRVAARTVSQPVTRHAAPARQAAAPAAPARRRERQLAKPKPDNDGDWKEF